jgi:3-methyl-2-oxobutanoate hydroxymethyltransferase
MPITVLTAYDFFTAQQCERGDIDICLVGDSLAQVALGYTSTTSLTLDEMLHHCRAVTRGCKTPHLVADLPFGTYQVSVEDAIRSAVRLVQEGGVESVKLEGGLEVVSVVRALTTVGIPVMAHIGLLPQRTTLLSGYRVQGKDARTAIDLLRSAHALQEAGAYAMVLEAIPDKLASYITSKLAIPTIGIGAGPGTDGQVLVWDDAMGSWTGHQPKFVRRFAELGSSAELGVAGYAAAVRERDFPSSAAPTYEMKEGEWEAFMERVEGKQ